MTFTVSPEALWSTEDHSRNHLHSCELLLCWQCCWFAGGTNGFECGGSIAGGPGAEFGRRREGFRLSGIVILNGFGSRFRA